MDSPSFLVKRPAWGNSTASISSSTAVSTTAFLISKPPMRYTQSTLANGNQISLVSFLVKKPDLKYTTYNLASTLNVPSATAFLLPKVGLKKWQPGENAFQIWIIRPAIIPTYPATKPVREGDVKFFGNVSVDSGDVDRDNTFSTAVAMSLFTDKRAFPDDELPSYSRDVRGFWGDPELGSRLWLLSRSKNIDSVRDQAKFYCLEALKWMVEDGLCQKVIVDVSRYDTYTISIGVQIIAVEQLLFKYRYNWKLQMLETP